MRLRELTIIFIVGLIISGIGAYCISNQDSEVTIAVISVEVGIVALFITTYFQNKNQQTHGLIRAFDKLNNDKSRANRKRILQSYYTLLDTKEITLESIEQNTFEKKDIDEVTKRLRGEGKIIFENAVKQIRTDYDEVGSMLKNNLIPKDAFLDVYWGNIVRCWGALAKYIENAREYPLTSHFMTNFEFLKDQAVEYWRKHHSDIPHISYYESSSLESSSEKHSG